MEAGQLRVAGVVVLELGSSCAVLRRPLWLRGLFIGGLFFLQLALSLWLQTLATFPWLAMYVFWPRWETYRRRKAPKATFLDAGAGA